METHTDLEPCSDLVDNQRGQGLTLDILGDDEQWPLSSHHLLQDGKEGREAAKERQRVVKLLQVQCPD